MINQESIIEENFLNYKKQIGSASIIAVAKYYGPEFNEYAYNIGMRDFGEARVNNLRDKARVLDIKCPDIIWHFIGHLQTNKVNTLFKIKKLKYIHSIDSLKLLEVCLSKMELLQEDVGIFLQMNTSGEDEKSGLQNERELDLAFEMLNSYHGPSDLKLKLTGLMTMSKLRTDDFLSDAHICFSKLKSYKQYLYETCGLNDLKLSMGMSRDFTIALKYEADFLRIGRGLFEEA